MAANDPNQINPLQWKREHKIALLCVIGLGLFVGGFIGMHEVSPDHFARWWAWGCDPYVCGDGRPDIGSPSPLGPFLAASSAGGLSTSSSCSERSYPFNVHRTGFPSPATIPRRRNAFNSTLSRGSRRWRISDPSRSSRKSTTNNSAICSIVIGTAARLSMSRTARLHSPWRNIFAPLRLTTGRIFSGDWFGSKTQQRPVYGLEIVAEPFKPLSSRDDFPGQLRSFRAQGAYDVRLCHFGVT